MPRQVDSFLLRGGLDLVSPPLAIQPGRMWACLNLEPVEAGYRRIRGYERYSGRPSPSDALYWILPVTLAAGEHPPQIGEVVRSGDKSATLLAITADGDYVISAMATGDLFANGDVLHVTREFIEGVTLAWEGQVLTWQGQSLTWREMM